MDNPTLVQHLGPISRKTYVNYSRYVRNSPTLQTSEWEKSGTVTDVSLKRKSGTVTDVTNI